MYIILYTECPLKFFFSELRWLVFLLVWFGFVDERQQNHILGTWLPTGFPLSTIGSQVHSGAQGAEVPFWLHIAHQLVKELIHSAMCLGPPGLVHGKPPGFTRLARAGPPGWGSAALCTLTSPESPLGTGKASMSINKHRG